MPNINSSLAADNSGGCNQTGARLYCSIVGKLVIISDRIELNMYAHVLQLGTIVFRIKFCGALLMTSL